MKRLSRLTLSVCAFAGLITGVGIQTASAQSFHRFRVTLPQEVSVGGVTLPAGEYTVSDITRSGGAAVLAFHSASGVNTSVLVEPVAEADVSANKLVFRSAGDRLQLDQVWIADEGMEFRVPVRSQTPAR